MLRKCRGIYTPGKKIDLMAKSIIEIRKIILRRRKKKPFLKRNLTVYRLLRRRFFQIVRFMVYFGFRLWLKKVHDSHRLPKEGPAIIISNHLSYYDWAVLSAIYWDRYLVFIGNKDLLNRFFVGWLMQLNVLIFINPVRPGFSYFKEVIKKLREGQILVIYPEGTRSRTGKMLEPKNGFVKIAIKTGAPVIPVAMSGTYEILSPHKKLPAFRRCEVFVGEPIFINKKNPMFKDIYKRKPTESLDDDDQKEIAFRIMQKIRKMSGQEWDETVSFEY